MTETSTNIANFRHYISGTEWHERLNFHTYNWRWLLRSEDRQFQHKFRRNLPDASRFSAWEPNNCLILCEPSLSDSGQWTQRWSNFEADLKRWHSVWLLLQLGSASSGVPVGWEACSNLELLCDILWISLKRNKGTVEHPIWLDTGMINNDHSIAQGHLQDVMYFLRWTDIRGVFCTLVCYLIC